MLEIIGYTAIIILGASYWFQIYKIFKNKEVADLSFTYHLLLAIGFFTMAIIAYIKGSQIFLIKQLSTLTPVLVIISQILFYKKCNKSNYCKKCNYKVSLKWKYCPNCSSSINR